MGEEEAVLKTIWEVLERTGILGAQDSSGDAGEECERLWGSLQLYGESLGTGVGVENAEGM